MRAWIQDAWLAPATETTADGTVVRMNPPSAVKTSLARNMAHPAQAKVPERFKTAKYGRGRRWTVRWRDETGRQRSRCFTEQRDAEAYVAELEDDIRSGRYADPRDKRRTVAEAAELWAAGLHGTVKGSTELRYLRELRIWVLPRWGHVRLGDITTARIQAWVSALNAGLAPRDGKSGRARPLAPKSIRSIAGIVLRSVLELAVREGWIPANPAKGVKMPRQQIKTPRVYLEPSEIGLLCSHMRRDDATAIMLMAFTGLRLGEALGLRVGDVDYSNHRVHVERTVSVDREGGQVETLPKGNKTRIVPLPAKLEQRLRELTDGHEPDAYLIRAPRGGGWSPNNWRNRVWYPALRKAGMDEIAGLVPHSLRHTYASLAIARGSDVKTLQAVMGHASAVETLDTYADLWPDKSDDVANAIDNDITMA